MKNDLVLNDLFVYFTRLGFSGDEHYAKRRRSRLLSRKYKNEFSSQCTVRFNDEGVYYAKGFQSYL